MHSKFFSINFAGYIDRKSTSLNSRHSEISYAVFCLNNKKISKIKVAGTAMIKLTFISIPNFSVFTYCFSSVSKSASSNSVSIISASRTGSTDPSTWVTLSSLKQRITCIIAATCLICPRNRLPRDQKTAPV